MERLASLYAVLGPPGAALLMLIVAGRGGPLPPALLASIIIAPWLLSFGWLARRRRRVAVLAGAELAALLAFVASFLPLDVPVPLAPYPYALPTTQVPTGVSIHSIETGVIHRTAAFAYRGGGFSDARTFTMNAVLVRHPAGDLLIDTGFGAAVETHLAQMPVLFRLATHVEPTVTAAAALRGAGYDPERLHAILLTHAHWDHVSGAPDLAPTPVWLPIAERAFMRDGWITAAARDIAPDRLRSYAFDDGPYLHYAVSHDVFHDGAVVVVPTPGHTPGSVAVFVTVSSGQRYALLGDLVWQLEGVTLRSERPMITRIGDSDPAAVRAELDRIAALHARYPQIELVPAHDPRGYARIPPLGRLDASSGR